MSVNVLKLDCDNLVIGGGVAGLVSAMRLDGKTILVSSGLGSSAISGGVLSSSRRVPEIDRWFIGQLQRSSCPYVEGKCITDMRAGLHGLVPEIAACPDHALMVSIGGVPSAGTLNLDIPVFSGRSYQEIAGLIESDSDAFEALSGALKAHRADSYLLPPVLGIRRTTELREALKEQTGADIYEYITAPSAHGLRLVSALRAIVDKKPGVTVVEPARVESIADGATGRLGTVGRRLFRVEASRLILATGGPLTGFVIEDDRVYEPLTGKTVADIGMDLDQRFLADHPLMFKGIGVQHHVTGCFKNIVAVGAVATGFGLYEALKAGYYAGD